MPPRQPPTADRQPPQAGQGLLEMIVAIGIIVTGVVSTVTLVTASLAASVESEARLIAANLAREGIEAARSIRDTNWLAAAPWNAGLVGTGDDRVGIPVFTPVALPGGEPTWTVDFGASALTDPQAVVHRGKPGSGILEDVFLQFPGSPSGDVAATTYRRLLALYPVCRDPSTGAESIVASENATCPVGQEEAGADVRSTVTWTVKGQPHSVTAEEKLYDWR